ncbi:hypothetical protein D3C75_521360 [compost metagenome]
MWQDCAFGNNMRQRGLDARRRDEGGEYHHQPRQNQCANGDDLDQGKPELHFPEDSNSKQIQSQQYNQDP